MRRLFSTFAQGPPGVGLLLLRVVTVGALLSLALTRDVPDVLAAGAGVLLLVGLWTPVAGAFVALVQLWNLFSKSGDPWIFILTGTLGLALALLGPGGWSLDARIFGWKRIDIRDRNRSGHLRTRSSHPSITI